jgi:hypothetical protein
MIMKDVLPEADGLELPFRVARGARLLGLVRLMERNWNIFLKLFREAQGWSP